MTPTTWLTILSFFFFIAPGLLYDLLAANKRVKRRESAFTEVSRVALVSTLCSASAFILVAGVAAATRAWWNWKLLPDPPALIKQGSAYFADHFILVLASFVVLVTVALFFGWLAYRCIHVCGAETQRRNSVISYDSAWREVMLLRQPPIPETEPSPPSRAHVYARVTMKDGAIWAGRVLTYSPDMEVVDRELVLTRPLSFRAKPNSTTGTRGPWQEVEKEYVYVILKDAEISYIAIQYDDPAAPQYRPPRTRLTPSGPPPPASGPA